MKRNGSGVSPTQAWRDAAKRYVLRDGARVVPEPPFYSGRMVGPSPEYVNATPDAQDQNAALAWLQSDALQGNAKMHKNGEGWILLHSRPTRPPWHFWPRLWLARAVLRLLRVIP